MLIKLLVKIDSVIFVVKLRIILYSSFVFDYVSYSNGELN